MRRTNQDSTDERFYPLLLCFQAHQTVSAGGDSGGCTGVHLCTRLQAPCARSSLIDSITSNENRNRSGRSPRCLSGARPALPRNSRGVGQVLKPARLQSDRSRARGVHGHRISAHRENPVARGFPMIGRRPPSRPRHPQSPAQAGSWPQDRRSRSRCHGSAARSWASHTPRRAPPRTGSSSRSVMPAQ